MYFRHEEQEEWLDAEKCYQQALDLQPDSQEAKESIRYVRYKQVSYSLRFVPLAFGEHSGSVEECLTRDRGATGSSLTGALHCGP